MGRSFAIMLMMIPALVACTQPQALSTTPRATGSLFANRTATVIPSVEVVAPAVPTTAHNPFATARMPAEQASVSPSGATNIPETRVSATEITTVSTPPASSTPSASNTPTPGVIVIPKTMPPLSNEERWRMQQLNRSVFNPIHMYTIQGQAALLWYDPLNAQAIEIGLLHGSVPVQARFDYRPYQAAALEVPYRINVDFGLTSISDAVLERMRQAGYTETVEGFIIVTDSIQPQN